MAMPDGVPETVNVVCQGRHGVLNVRTQRVVHDGTDMPVSQFEKVCGRGDAKKWKHSLW